MKLSTTGVEKIRYLAWMFFILQEKLILIYSFKKGAYILIQEFTSRVYFPVGENILWKFTSVWPYPNCTHGSAGATCKPIFFLSRRSVLRSLTIRRPWSLWKQTAWNWPMDFDPARPLTSSQSWPTFVACGRACARQRVVRAIICLGMWPIGTSTRVICSSWLPGWRRRRGSWRRRRRRSLHWRMLNNSCTVYRWNICTLMIISVIETNFDAMVISELNTCIINLFRLSGFPKIAARIDLIVTVCFNSHTCMSFFCLLITPL